MPPLSPAQIACLIVVTIGAVCDLRTKKIPNLLTFPAAALGIVLQLIQSGPPGALSAVEGWFAALGIMLLTRFLGWKSCPFGGGDLKLIAAVGSLLGPGDVLLVLWWFFLSFAFVNWWRLASALPWRQFIRALPALVSTGSLTCLAGIDWTTFNQARKAGQLFGPFYAVGTYCAIFFRHATRVFFGFN